MQTKKQSLLEASLNTFSGMLLSFSISQLAHVLEPWVQHNIWKEFIWNLSVSSNVVMTIILTFVSIVRSYLWRRYFNKRG